MTIEPGTRAILIGMGGGPCEVVRDMGDRGVRVHMLPHPGKARTVPHSRLRITPEPTALGGDYVPEATIASPTREGRSPIDEAWHRASDDWRSRPTHGTRPVRQREPRVESPRYLAYVRIHACCYCGASGPSEPHHWSHHGGSMGAKCDDYRTVPLCSTCHRHWHDHGMLAGLDRVASEDAFVRTQRWLLDAWLDTQHMPERPDRMVDALVEALRKMEADR